MKKIVLCIILLICSVFSSLLYSTNRSQYQVVEVYVCDMGLNLAELKAMARVSRQDLYSVSYCTCLGMHEELKDWVEGDSCEPPNDKVYSCTCIGKSGY